MAPDVARSRRRQDWSSAEKKIPIVQRSPRTATVDRRRVVALVVGIANGREKRILHRRVNNDGLLATEVADHGNSPHGASGACEVALTGGVGSTAR